MQGLPKTNVVSFIPSSPPWAFFLHLSPLELKLPTPKTSLWDFCKEAPPDVCLESAASSVHLLSHTFGPPSCHPLDLPQFFSVLLRPGSGM